MPNDKNKQAVADLKDKLSKAKSVTIADYRGLSAQAVNELRAKMKETDAEVVVTKNTLLKVAMKDVETTANNMPSLEKDLEGPTAAIFAYSDAINPIKAIYELVKKFELPKIKSAIIDGIYNTAEQVDVIKSLPSREQLLAQIVGGFQSPIKGFVSVTGGVQRKLVYALAAVAEKKKA